MSAIFETAHREAAVTSVSPLSKVISTPVLIGFALALIYSLSLTSDYFWDGITFALHIEKVANGRGSARLLFHQNHLLYNALGYLLYSLNRVIGVKASALLVLQVANVVFASLAGAVFYQVAERMTRNRRAAAASSMALGLSAVWWKLSTDADSYILAALLLLLCVRNILSERPSWYISAMTLAGGMLVHEMSSLFFPAALILVYANGEIQLKRRFAARMSLLAWSLTIGVYYLCAGTVVGITDPIAVVKWATSNPASDVFSTNPIHGILIAPRKNIEAIIGHDFALFKHDFDGLALVTALLSVTAAFVLIFRIGRSINFKLIGQTICSPERTRRGQRDNSLLGLITWISVYVLFLFFWEPEDFYYPVFYMPALALLLSKFSSKSGSVRLKETSHKRGLPFINSTLAIAALGLFNLAFFIRPHTHPDSNSLVMAARITRGIWDKNTVVYFANHSEVDTTFEYFNQATEWRRLRRGGIAEIETEIEAASKDGRSVWVNKGAMELIDPYWLSRHSRGPRITLDALYSTAYYTELMPDMPNQPQP